MESSPEPEAPLLIVADPVPDARRLLGIMLAPLAHPSVEAATGEEAIAAARAHPGALVLVDLSIPADEAAELLEVLIGLESAPMVCAMSAAPSAEEEARVLMLGALAYFEKPVAPERVAAAIALADVAQEELLVRRRLSGPTGYASALDSLGRPMLRWVVENVSASGLFLRTTAPLRSGETLLLDLDLAGTSFQASVRVQRSQPPSWMTAGGIGVEFVEMEPTARARLATALERLEVRGGDPGDSF
jgi:CheY-like chemotaxis protein